MDALREELIALAEPGGHFFSEDTLTDQPERVIAFRNRARENSALYG